MAEHVPTSTKTDESGSDELSPRSVSQVSFIHVVDGETDKPADLANCQSTTDQPSKKSRLLRWLRSARLKLYCSRFLSSWGDRLWTFALGLVLVEVGGNLQLPAVSGLVDDVSVLLLGSFVGRWLDRTDRLTAARVALVANNFVVTASALCLFGALIVLHDGEWYRLRWLLVAAAIVFCAAGVLAGSACKIIVTKDWIMHVALDNRAKLADLNAVMVRIDQLAMTLSPLLAGQIMTSFGLPVGCLFIAGWNLVSFGIEYWFLSAVHSEVASLREPKVIDEPHVEPHRDSDNINAWYHRVVGRLRLGVGRIFGAWHTYYHQISFAAALALALLYLTVLGLDSITTGYAYQQGLAENYVGLMRGAGALFGFLGSFAFPKLRRCVGLPWTGFISLLYQCACNVLCVASVWLPGSPFDPVGYFTDDARPPINGSSVLPTLQHQSNSTISIWTFMSGLVLARFGLWMSDLSISQTMQESALECDRGSVFGVQNAMNSALNLCKNVLVIILPDARTFGLLICVSWCSVFAGFISYNVYLCRQRNRSLTT